MKLFLRPLLFLVAVSAILLLSDLQNRTGHARERQQTRLAVFRFNSNQILEETEQGILKAIAESQPFRQGLVDIHRYSSEGDMAIANTIARNIISEKFDMVVSISTPGLQVMANANKSGEILHIFGAVTDPVASGVGITGPAPDQHPPFLVGVGTFQPVEDVFRVAKTMYPPLSRVGVVWCTGETCSEACVIKARAISKELGISLLEMSVENVSQVYEAALAVCAKGVEALWIGGDNVVEPAIEMLVAAGLKSKIPVLSNNPKHALRGAMVNLGANYFQVGQVVGNLVNDILNGLDPKSVEIKNVVPEKLFINDSIRRLMKDPWILTDDLRARTDSIIG